MGVIPGFSASLAAKEGPAALESGCGVALTASGEVSTHPLFWPVPFMEGKIRLL